MDLLNIQATLDDILEDNEPALEEGEE
jgi:hypothetical protein